MPFYITVPPSQFASFVVGSCGPRGKQKYEFTQTLDTILPQDVRVLLGSDGGAAFLQGAALGVYDLNLQADTRITICCHRSSDRERAVSQMVSGGPARRSEKSSAAIFKAFSARPRPNS